MRRELTESEGEGWRIPIIRLRDVLIVSIQGSLQDTQAQRLHEDILAQIGATNASGVVLDISAVPIMDSYIARILNNIARNAKLMGSRAVVVGMQPAIAITLVTMGLEFEDLETALNLERAIEQLGSDHGRL